MKKGPIVEMASRIRDIMGMDEFGAFLGQKEVWFRVLSMGSKEQILPFFIMSLETISDQIHYQAQMKWAEDLEYWQFSRIAKATNLGSGKYLLLSFGNV